MIVCDCLLAQNLSTAYTQINNQKVPNLAAKPLIVKIIDLSTVLSFGLRIGLLLVSLFIPSDMSSRGLMMRPDC